MFIMLFIKIFYFIISTEQLFLSFEWAIFSELSGIGNWENDI